MMAGVCSTRSQPFPRKGFPSLLPSPVAMHCFSLITAALLNRLRSCSCVTAPGAPILPVCMEPERAQRAGRDHKDHPAQLLARHTHPNNPTLSLEGFSKHSWSSGSLWAVPIPWGNSLFPIILKFTLTGWILFPHPSLPGWDSSITSSWSFRCCSHLQQTEAKDTPGGFGCLNQY